MKMGPRKALVREVNPYLMCVLCSGYFIEAATIVECLHSFCRSCLVKYLEKHRFCPKCDVQLHKHNPLLSVRCDPTLQQLVYKLIPGLYANEMARRKKYYSQMGVDNDMPVGDTFFSPDDSISLSLEFIGSKDPEEESGESELILDKQGLHRRYLQCPAAVNMSHLKKFLRMKYNLTPEHKVDIIYEGESLEDDFSLMDVAYTFSWNKATPMRFKYRFFQKKKIKVMVPKETFKGVVDQTEGDSPSKGFQLPPSTRNGLSNGDSRAMPKHDLRMTQNVRVCVQKLPEPKEEEEKPKEKPKKKKKEPEEKFEEPAPKKQKIEEKVPEHFELQKGFEEDFQDDDEDEDRLRISSPEEDIVEEKMEVEPVPEVPVRSEERRREKKKSKKQKHHHHHRHHDRKRESSPPAATILPTSENDIMKLKVKLTKTTNKVTKYTVEGIEERKEPKESSYLKQNGDVERKAPEKAEVKPAEKPSEEEKKKSDVVNNNKPECTPKAVDNATKEKLLQTLRPKPPVQNGVSEPIKLPPSSITVSKITAEEKRQMEQQKLLELNKNNGDESKRPSLEIMLVNAPNKSEPEPKPVEAPKKQIRPPPPSIPLKNLGRNLSFVNSLGLKSNSVQKLVPPVKITKPLEARKDDSGVLDLSEKSSRKSPDVNGTPRPDLAMRNLMTLTETAVQVRNMMNQESTSPTTLKIPVPGLILNNKVQSPYHNSQVKPRPNQNIRQIPNPSALMSFRTNGRSLLPPPVMPLSSLRKMESMARNIDKLAAGLTVKAVEAAYGVK